MSDLKVLIIPSWYPTPKQPLTGSFFHEQAQFLQGKEGLDFQVLYGEKKSYTLILWIWVFVKSRLKPTWPISTSKVRQGPTAYGFDIPANRRVPDQLQINLEKKIFLKAYRSLVLSGWVPDLIHAQSGMDAGIYAHHISQETNIPFLIMEHQVFVFHYYSKLRGTLIMDAFQSAQKTAAVSWDERRQVMMNQPQCNPKVIWNLVDEAQYMIDLGKRRKAFTVITLLNSLFIKGAEDFIEAMAIVLQYDPEIRFIMIGKGGDKKSSNVQENLFVRKSKELGIFEKGEFLPVVPRDQISNVLNQAHVFVSPSIQEPHGIAVREAMMCGLPIISTANGGVEDSVTPETGLVVPVKQPETMAAAIIAMKKNYSRYKPERIRELAINQCGKEAFLGSMVDFYHFENQ
ncbi:Glycosyltransferase involved in cell wall bisynthesis [Algoriphagus faecimaris]|uniref:Glycosyltransferase involved in cell wall bisynthesis n=1 Tax=Algoriphagus faecimaris TaxID=686796 RepID=A0A1G6PRG5_9BACT|nr:glycosyltransferase [Algoriphagus faecimaris]SDC82832.1 Glycosyltransferase involved in cell wall bisynthesis [Algoriphagus faecimaris]